MIDLRGILRALILDTEGLSKGETEQAITCALKDIQQCRYCAFEKESQAVQEKFDSEDRNERDPYYGFEDPHGDPPEVNS